ncbi:LysR substrate-binding domain-containing protein [Marinobacter sp. 71-i]|uniref:LysR substrate-binding domain-containing protein n=1 Tax=Marinobacter iranensis TaxID=2962607 RepID=A0ABT5YFW6_9GAMM|nr:LysR substrate-binding domain-containing protein [Marinobacter iranensis]MDF0752585.1 LysR substrate-binding domain-containing protein [Marinobacter iranensis]
MELRHLRYFSALAETLNFTRAAEKNHVTQSTLSHQIKQLEEELSVPLFERVGKRVLITEAGDSLLAQITPALKQIDLAVNALLTSPGTMTGCIRIGATYTFNTNLVPKYLATFLSKNPEMKIVSEELPQAEIIRKLEEDSLDLGIAYRPNEGHDLWFEPLFNEEMVLITGVNHPLAKRKRVRMIELNNMRMTLLPKIFNTRQQLDECFRACGAEPQIVVEMNAISPMLELVRQTDLVAIVGETALDSAKGLSAVALENPTPIRTPGVLWKKGGRENAAVNEFAAMIRRSVALREGDG